MSASVTDRTPKVRLRYMIQLRKDGRYEAVPANKQAGLTIHGADKLTATDRKRIAEWLHSTARTVLNKRSLFTKRFRAALYR